MLTTKSSTWIGTCRIHLSMSFTTIAHPCWSLWRKFPWPKYCKRVF